jgi:CRP-like cAMP-binding protein/SAM-dependent methyltransferase
MTFLDLLPDAPRERLLAAARPVRLREGELLLRRGERGGDLFLVDEGRFEVVDRRQQPEVVLSVVGPGAVLGEMSFLDESPRSVDVRATGDGAVRRWEHASLRALLEAEPELAAAFYRALAEVTAERLRELNVGAARGTIAPRVAVDTAEDTLARRLAARVLTKWHDADTAFRRSPGSLEASEGVRAGFDVLLQETCSWLRTIGDPERAAAAGAALARDLRPYLVRASLAQLSLDPAARRSGDPRLAAHALLGQAQGEGEMGTIIDTCLLALPTIRALRLRTDRAARATLAEVPADRPARIALLNAGAGALLARLMAPLGRSGAVIDVLDGSREVLAFVDAGLVVRPRSVAVRLRLVDWGPLVLDRAPLGLEDVDLCVIDGLLDYLPDRLAAALISRAARALAPGGRLVLTGLAPSPDAPLFDHLLDWPSVRRPARDLRALVEAMGLAGAVVAGRDEDPEPAVVVTGVRRAAAPPAPAVG